jgi:hypothetical protein
MKRPISWYQNCFANRILSLARSKEQLETAQRRYNQDLEGITFYQQQREYRRIDCAIREHKDSFDSEKYKKARRKQL